MARRIVLHGARGLAGEDFAYDPAPLDVVIEGDRIAAIGPAGSAGPAGEAIDLAGRLLVPGLVNRHLHSHEHFLKGRTENLPLELWMHHGRSGLAVPLTPRQTYLRTLVGANRGAALGHHRDRGRPGPRAPHRPREPRRGVPRGDGEDLPPLPGRPGSRRHPPGAAALLTLPGL